VLLPTKRRYIIPATYTSFRPPRPDDTPTTSARATELRDQGHAEALRLEYTGVSQERLGRRRAYSPGSRPRQIGWGRLYRPISRNVAIFCRSTIDSYRDRYFCRVTDAMSASVDPLTSFDRQLHRSSQISVSSSHREKLLPCRFLRVRLSP